MVAGTEVHGLLSLARRYRTAVPYFKDSAFENLIDIFLKQRERMELQYRLRWHGGDTGLEDWGVINLLHRFRNKKCAIRRDRIYSLLPLCKEAKKFKVDYEVSEAEVMRQVLNIQKDSICLCSAAIAAHALGPWDFPKLEPNASEEPFAEIHMYACALGSTVCPFCPNWVPSSWRRRRGVVFCFATACPDTPGHLFLEQPDPNTQSDGNDAGTGDHSSESIHVQRRQNNKSQLLCKNGAGISALQSQWKHVYHLRFTLRALVDVLWDDASTGDLGLNACGNLWPSDSNQRTTDEARLRLCSNG